MKVFAVSDAHGYLNELRQSLRLLVGEGPPDLLVFCGDMIDHSVQRTRLARFFYDLRTFYGGPILAVPGNHEAQASRMALPIYWDRFVAQFRSQGVQFLLDGVKQIDVGQRRPFWVGGLSWNPVYGTVVSEAVEKAVSSEIVAKLSVPEGSRLDLLLHHAPPRGILDRTRWKGPSQGGRSMGSGAIRRIVDSLSPAVSVFGHCHESAGVKTVGDTLFVNACVFTTRRGFSGTPMAIRKFKVDLNCVATPV